MKDYVQSLPDAQWNTALQQNLPFQQKHTKPIDIPDKWSVDAPYSTTMHVIYTFQSCIALVWILLHQLSAKGLEVFLHESLLFRCQTLETQVVRHLAEHATQSLDQYLVHFCIQCQLLSHTLVIAALALSFDLHLFHASSQPVRVPAHLENKRTAFPCSGNNAQMPPRPSGRRQHLQIHLRRWIHFGVPLANIDTWSHALW